MSFIPPTWYVGLLTYGRDIFYQLRDNGTYKIKYYGWREGFTNSFPNILSVEQVVDENGTVPPSYNKYFGINLVGGGFSG